MNEFKVEFNKALTEATARFPYQSDKQLIWACEQFELVDTTIQKLEDIHTVAIDRWSQELYQSLCAVWIYVAYLNGVEHGTYLYVYMDGRNAPSWFHTYSSQKEGWFEAEELDKMIQLEKDKQTIELEEIKQRTILENMIRIREELEKQREQHAAELKARSEAKAKRRAESEAKALQAKQEAEERAKIRAEIKLAERILAEKHQKLKQEKKAEEKAKRQSEHIKLMKRLTEKAAITLINNDIKNEIVESQDNAVLENSSLEMSVSEETSMEERDMEETELESTEKASLSSEVLANDELDTRNMDNEECIIKDMDQELLENTSLEDTFMARAKAELVGTSIAASVSILMSIVMTYNHNNSSLGGIIISIAVSLVMSVLTWMMYKQSKLNVGKIEIENVIKKNKAKRKWKGKGKGRK